MDLSKYKCLPTKDSYRRCLQHQMGCKEYINIFKRVKNKYDFDITSYHGALPVAIISLDKKYVYGYTSDITVTSILQLEPHKSNPPMQYMWSNIKPACTMSYKEIMFKLNHRCVQLGNPPPELSTGIKFFEESRYIMFLCVLETQCITMEHLIELETRYMKAITSTNNSILSKCKELYKLDNATQEDLARWIHKIYTTSKKQYSTNGLFMNVGKQVKEMLM